MRLNATSYYQTDKPGRTQARLYVLAWLEEDDGTFVEEPPADPVSIRILKLDKYDTVIRKSENILPGSDGFYSVSLGIHWGDEEFQYVASTIRLAVSNSCGTVYPKIFIAPYMSSVWGAVYQDTLKLGVLAMADQTQPLDVIANRIYDSVRQAIAVGPGNSNRFCQTLPTYPGTSWGASASFGFDSVGFGLTNFGNDTVEFSLDGVDVHGVVPPYMKVVYDFRRETQLFTRSATAYVDVTVEAW